MIIGIQITAILFAFSMIYFAILHYKRGELNGLEMGSWFIMWALTMVIVIFPELLQGFARAFFVTRVFDLMVIGGFVLVISMVATAYLRTKRNEKKLEDLVRREALRNAKRKK
jgi:hypothetical protein